MTRLPLLCCSLLLACPEPEPSPPTGPYDMPMAADGVLYAGVATIDVTPEIAETFTDLNDNAIFDGCLDNPDGGTENCPEGFDDLDGNGSFDPVWIGGFDYLRPALDVRDNDGISVRALVLAYNGSYVAFAVGDFIGLAQNRMEQASALLETDGFDPDRFLGGSTHNHQGPDTLGLWGDPLAGESGFDPEYQDRVAAAMYRAVKEAASSVEPIDLRVDAVAMRDRSPWFNGSTFGGKNPTAKMHGMVHDIRDPVIVSDQLLTMQGRRSDDSVLFTFTNWSGHPEVRGDNSNSLSADWVGVTRAILEDHYGGTAIHFPESLGGMQSAFGGDLPLVGLNGVHAFEVCTVEAVADPEDDDCFGMAAGSDKLDADGDKVPVWATKHSVEFMVSHGWHIAEAAMDLMDAAEPVEVDLIRVEHDDAWVAVRNVAYNLLGPMGIFDVPLEDAATDSERCPEARAEDLLGCLPFRSYRVQIGPVTFLSAPGELFPELAWGFPTDDPAWVAEEADPAARAGGRYFPQHDPDCNDIEWEDCRESSSVGDCDCLSVHAWPYALSYSDLPPVLESVDTPYKAVLSATGQYLSYIIPEPSTNKSVSLFTEDGDHYEDVVTVGWGFGTDYLEAQQRIAERW